jgi:hypothetical protein
VRFLPQRVEGDTTLGHPHGAGKIASLLQVGNLLAQRLEEALSQPLPLLQHPLLAPAGKQLAAVELHCPGDQSRALGTGGGAGRGFESRGKLRDIRRHRGGVEADTGAVGVEDRPERHAGRLQFLPQPVEGRLQVVEARAPLDLRPQELHQLLARERARGTAAGECVEREVGEKQARLLGTKAHDHMVALHRSQPAQQLDPPRLAQGAPPPRPREQRSPRDRPSPTPPRAPTRSFEHEEEHEEE